MAGRNSYGGGIREVGSTLPVSRPNALSQNRAMTRSGQPAPTMTSASTTKNACGPHDSTSKKRTGAAKIFFHNGVCTCLRLPPKHQDCPQRMWPEVRIEWSRTERSRNRFVPPTITPTVLQKCSGTTLEVMEGGNCW